MKGKKGKTKREKQNIIVCFFRVFLLLPFLFLLCFFFVLFVFMFFFFLKKKKCFRKPNHTHKIINLNLNCN